MSEVNLTPLVSLYITDIISKFFRSSIIYEMKMGPCVIQVEHYMENIYKVKIYPDDDWLFKFYRWILMFTARYVNKNSRIAKPIEILIMEEYNKCKRWVEDYYNVILEFDEASYLYHYGKEN